MPLTLMITEIIRRAEQGTSQISEWICSHLASAYGLPIPEFCLVYIDPELWQETRTEYQHIGYGTAFG